MPANLTPEYIKAEQRYAQAKSIEDKIAATEEMIRLAPKHKGTEKLMMFLKKRLAKLREEQKEKRERKGGRSSQAFALKKEGAAQIALLGLPSSGKSALLKKLTSAKPEVADYPFTTREPTPGMMQYEDVQIQLVEAPAVVEGSSAGKGLGARPLSVARVADTIALVVDASSDPVKQTETLLKELETGGIKLNQRPPAFSIERTSSGGIELMGAELVEGGEAEVKRILLNHSIHNAIVLIDERMDAKEFEEALLSSSVYKQAFIFVTKCDSPGASEKIDSLRWEFGSRFKIILTDKSADAVKKEAYIGLDLVRIYTKPPDGPPAKRPLVLPRGSNVADVAEAVHRDFERKLKFARVWGSSKFPGQQVAKDYVLQDKDVVELHV